MPHKALSSSPRNWSAVIPCLLPPSFFFPVLKNAEPLFLAFLKMPRPGHGTPTVFHMLGIAATLGVDFSHPAASVFVWIHVRAWESSSRGQPMQITRMPFFLIHTLSRKEGRERKERGGGGGGNQNAHRSGRGCSIQERDEKMYRVSNNKMFARSIESIIELVWKTLWMLWKGIQAGREGRWKIFSHF